MQLNLLAEYDRLERLSELGDPLTKVLNVVDWELFRPALDETFEIEAKGPGGRPPMDWVMMFKVVMLQQWYGISDDSTEFAINDRLSFQRFLGLKLNDKVVDAKTIWLFKEKLKETRTDNLLFGLFAQQMKAQGSITRKGTLVDATFIDAPGKGTIEKKTRPSKKAGCGRGGTRQSRSKRASSAKKTWTHAGLRKTMKPITATRTMRKSTVTAK